MRAICFTLLTLLTLQAFASEPRVVLPGTSRLIPFPGHDTAVMADSGATPGQAAVLELVVPAKTFGAPPHIHADEDEFFYVLSGEVEFLDREARIEVGPGSLVILPRGHLHGFWNRSDQPASMLLVITPGEFAGFFDEVVAEIRRTNADTPERVGALIAKAAAARNVEVRMDKLPAGVMESLH